MASGRQLLRWAKTMRLVFLSRVELRVVSLAVFFVALGTFGLVAFEEPGADGNAPSLLDGLWWTVVTMTTVGYGDVAPASTTARFLIAVPVMLAGTGVLAYGLSMTAAWLIERKRLETHGMNKLDLRDHIVLVNYPGDSRVLDLVHELRSDARNRARDIVLVTDTIDEVPAALERHNIDFVHGSPINEAVLTKASVVHANQVIVFASHSGDDNSDSTNLGVVIGLRATNTKARVVVEVVSPRRKQLVLRAGADFAVCATALSSMLLAQAGQGESLQDLMSELASNRAAQQVDAVPLRLQGRDTASFSDIAAKLASEEIVVLGVRRNGEHHVNPGRAYQVRAGDELLVVSATRPRTLTYEG